MADRSAHLRSLFASLGADDPDGWARSEIDEDIPQLARFLVLRGLWNDTIDSWRDPSAIASVAAGERLVAAGADIEDLTTFARAVAYEAVFGTLARIDEGYDPDVEDDELPGWLLMETDADEAPTGRHVGSLHEDLLGLDPSGQEGADLWR